MEIMCLTVKSSYGLTNNQELLQMGRVACDAAVQAQLVKGDERARLLNMSQGLRERELAGWLATKTDAMPDGDMLGASMAAMGIANVHLLRGTTDSIELARMWYDRAEVYCPKNNDTGAVHQRFNLKQNKQQLQVLESVARIVDKEVVVKGLVKQPKYNGRRGKVLDMVSSKRFQVLLHAPKSEIDSKMACDAECISVHIDNLELV